MSNSSINDEYWRRKLSAFMHDNPAKGHDILHHELRAFLQRRVDELTDPERYDKQADFHAAAADRLPFPHAGKLRVDFSQGENAFHHPLSPGEKNRFGIDRRMTADLIDEISQNNRTYLEETDARADFIARWRFWRAWCSDRNPALAYLPADTRIPDHSIWNHLGMTSAFQGCLDRDRNGQIAFLLLSIGPVQSFIAAARNIRDLWSGSYLLSYLMSVAIGELAAEYGPDHAIFPNPWAQPLVDLQMRPILENAKVRADSDRTLWDQLWREDAKTRQSFLLPSLPNRMLAILPAEEAAGFAKRLAEAIGNRLRAIGEAVLRGIDIPLSKRNIDFDVDAFRRQVDSALEIHWHVLPMPNSIEATVELAERLPAEEGKKHPALESIIRLKAMWEALPNGDRTSYGMRNASTAWPILTALNAWCMDGVKASRLFEAWNEKSSWAFGRNCAKDALTGKEEALLFAPADEEEAAKLSNEISKGNSHLLRPNDQLGAMTIVKRFWHIHFLSNAEFHDFRPTDFRMPNLYRLAAGDPFSTEEAEDEESEGSYIAVLALDGDEMGKWVSGEKTPPVREQLHPKAREYFEKPELATPAIEEFLNGSRPLNPSFHLQFSEALSNFGKYAARRIVEAFDGRLIYAGGDDVLALLPASVAIECAQALRAAFRGETGRLKELRGAWKTEGQTPVKYPDIRLFADAPDGYLHLHPDLKNGFALEYEPVNWTAMAPGPKTDVSVGIAIGHCKSPLQDLVRAAQRAEKRAKNELNRGAVAIALFKRSGEQIQWGSKWSDDPRTGLLGLYRSIHRALGESGELSGRFPYRMHELLSPFLPADPDAEGMESGFIAKMREIVRADFETTLHRQYNGEKGRVQAFASEVLERFDDGWSELERVYKNPADRLRSFLGLLQLAAWTRGSKTEDKPELAGIES